MIDRREPASPSLRPPRAVGLLQAFASVVTATVQRWETLDPVAQTRVKVCALAVTLLTAYHYSLSSLMQTVSADTPLAYLGLVPVIAAGIAVLQRAPKVHEPPIHDRELDYILGVPMVLCAFLAMVVFPRRMGAMFWVERLDLLTLPVFATGTTILLFGTRVAWRQRVALGYLFLAWPWPYTTLLLGALGGFTSITLSGLKAVLHVIPVARAIPGAANAGLFEVSHNGRQFPVSVVTACSGIDGMVGFFLVGAAFACLIRGPMVRKLVWLALGLVLLWCTNLGRLLFIFAAGHLAGEHLALDILHPVAGIFFFCLGQLLMILLLKPFGLRLAQGVNVKAEGTSVTRVRAGVSRVYLSASVVALASLAVGVSDSRLTVFDPVANAAGQPKLGSFLAQPATPAGWTSAFLAEYTINKPLFGQSSRWFRYLYNDVDNTVGDLHSQVPITADVINAGGLSGFKNYGVTACYSFHGYTLRDVAQVNLGHGVSGQALSYAGSNSYTNWSIVYWIWPVATSSGTRYERVILYLQNTPRQEVTFGGTAPNVQGLRGALRTSQPAERLLMVNRAFLVAFAQEIITAQVSVHDTTVDVAALHPSMGASAAPVVTAATGSPASRPSGNALNEAWAPVRGSAGAPSPTAIGRFNAHRPQHAAARP